MPPCKFRLADTFERLKTIVQETFTIPLLDQELWYNVNVVDNVSHGKNIQSLAEAGIKVTEYRACQHGMECEQSIDPTMVP